MFCWETGFSDDPITFPAFTQFGHWDLETFIPDQVLQDCPANTLGWRTHIEIKSYPSLPVGGVPGVEILMFLLHDASGEKVTITNEFEIDSNPWRWDTDGFLLTPGYTTQVGTPGFPFPFIKVGDWAISDCFLFEREAPAPSVFAEFNEAGETYHLDGFAPNFGPTWRVEYDIRQRGTGNINVYGWSGHPNVRHYWSGKNCCWNSFCVDTGTALPIDTWIHILFDFEWDAPATQILRVIKDGGTPITRVIACTGIYGDRFGQTSSPPVGIFDLKNFTCLYGDATTPRVGHDCPMTTNACDIGPNEMGGVTTVMALPSCPP